MPRNVEIKASLGSEEVAWQLIHRISAEQQQEPMIIEQIDTFFRTRNHGRLKLREFGRDDEYVMRNPDLSDEQRERNRNGASGRTAELIYYERSNKREAKLSEFTAIDIDQAKELKIVLASAIGATVVVRKKRHLFLIDCTRVHIDEVDRLGWFMELEVVMKDCMTVQDGMRIAEDLCNHLGISSDALVATAYADLILDSHTAIYAETGVIPPLVL